MERMYVMNHIGENNTTLQGQRKSIFQTVWNRCIGNFSRRPAIFSSKMDNSLSTLLNNEIITPEYIKKSYVQEEKSVGINHMSNIIFETMQSMPPITVDSFNKSHLKTLSNCKHYFGNNFDKIEEHYEETTIEDVYNLDSNITCKNKKSTMESHSVSNVHEIENLNNISNNSCSTEVDLQKCIDTDKDGLDKDPLSSNDINEDTKSFLIVSHSDVPEPTKKAPISTRLSFMCRNAWNSLTTRFYCKTNSVKSEKSMKRPSYLSKRYRRRKANSIAMGRGRGRDRCQLRRSGVSQTRHRMERTKRDLAMIIEVDYKIYQNDKIQYCELQNDHSSNDESNNLDDMDGYDVPDGALLLKRTSPVIFSSSDITLTKQEPQMSKDQETMKHSTKVRYVIDSSTKSNKDCNKKTSDTEESLSRSRLLSVSSIDSEDSFIVFEANDESSRQQYSTEIHYTLDSSMKTNENCNSEIYDMHSNLSRSRLLSESSVDSEDSFIIFKDIENESPKKQETMKCLTKVRYIIDPLTKINNNYHKDCDETYNTLRSRLCSESSSADSEDSLIIFEGSDDDESSKQETTEDSTDIHDESDSSTVNNDHCKDYNNKKYMHEDSFQCSESSDTEDSFCIVFNTELEENCVEEETDNFNYIKTSTPTFKKDESMIESDEDSERSTTQTKKVSFAQTPIIHIMVTWNYAYRAARKGQWEEMARDNERFKGRINSIAAVLDPILTSKHRSKIWQERFSCQE